MDDKILREIRDTLQSIVELLDKNLPEKKTEQPTQAVITVSCDGSILKNPGGRCSVGVVIQIPGNKPNELSQFTPSSTNNEAEYDAIYLGLTTLTTLFYGDFPILIESDSKLVVDSLNKTVKLKEERLIKKRDLILEVVGLVEANISFVWKRRNSTPGLRRANDLAQLLNGVKPH